MEEVPTTDADTTAGESSSTTDDDDVSTSEDEGSSGVATGMAGESSGSAAGWAARRALTFDLAPLKEPVSEFPVMVALNAERIDYSLVQSVDGRDLMFVADDQQTVLPHEVERWQPEGVSIVWVRMPQLGTGSEQIWMYFGHSEPDVELDPAGVWDDDYAAVWHLGQQLDVEPAADSTRYGNTAFAQGEMDASAQVEAVVGDGIRFDGVDDFLEAAHSDAVDIRRSITIDFWVRVDAIDQEADRYAVLKSDAYFMHVLRQFGNSPAIYVHTGEDWRNRGLADELSLEWEHLAGTYDSEERLIRLYRNGEFVNMAAVPPEEPDPLIASNDNPVVLGRGVAGVLDEVRISSIRRSDTWIELQHRSSVDELVNFGSIEMDPAF